jgi:hypothetical protein
VLARLQKQKAHCCRVGSQHLPVVCLPGRAAPHAFHQVRYGFEVALAVSPALNASGNLSAAYLLLSGGYTGIFIGKYCRYLSALRKGMPSNLGPVH